MVTIIEIRESICLDSSRVLLGRLMCTIPVLMTNVLMYRDHDEISLSLSLSLCLCDAGLRVSLPCPAQLTGGRRCV